MLRFALLAVVLVFVSGASEEIVGKRFVLESGTLHGGSGSGSKAGGVWVVGGHGIGIGSVDLDGEGFARPEIRRPPIGGGVIVNPRPTEPTPNRCGFFCQQQATFNAVIDRSNQFVICQSANPQQCSQCCKSWGIHMGLQADHATGFPDSQNRCVCCANTC